MKLITKGDLIYRLGFLLVAMTQEIVPMTRLAAEYNELMDMKEFNEFLKSKKADILATGSGERVVYKPKMQDEIPPITSGIKVETPLLDEDKARAEARALEFLDVKVAERVDKHLARYVNLARWFNQAEVMLPTDDHIAGARFKGNILELIEEEVVDIVTTYHDPEIEKLRGLVTIDFS